VLILNTNRGIDFEFVSVTPGIERDLRMKLTVLKALSLPVALLALGGVNQASAVTCAASYTMAAVTATGFSCTLGALTFSNFDALYGTSGGASTPNETSAITVDISEATSGSDPFGTTASAGSPIYSVITDYTAGNSVAEHQSFDGRGAVFGDRRHRGNGNHGGRWRYHRFGRQ